MRFWPSLPRQGASGSRFASNAPVRLDGTLKLLLQGNNSLSPSTAVKGLPSKCQRTLLESFTVYQSTARDLAIQLLGWCSLQDGYAALDKKLMALEEEHAFEKAAALAIFHLDLERALQSLCKERANSSKFTIRAVE